MSVSKLRDGDYCPNGTGAFSESTGAEAVLERVLFKLRVHRGSFPLLPTLGSRLYQLPREKPSTRSALGASYAAEALADEDLTVTGAVWQEETQTLAVSLTWQGETLTAEVEV